MHKCQAVGVACKDQLCSICTFLPFFWCIVRLKVLGCVDHLSVIYM